MLSAFDRFEAIGLPGGGRPFDWAALVAAWAHEVKNPLSTIQLNLDMLAEQLAGDPRAERRLGLVRGECTRLKNLVERFSELVRPIEPASEPANVNAHLHELVEFLRPQAQQQRVSLTTQFCEPLPTVLLDPDAFRAAVLNLVLNALAAYNNPGVLSLITSALDSAVVIQIEDTGCGMDAPTLERAFGVFFSTRREGTGLGLPIARHLIESLGGQLELTSRPGVGTTARIVLPATRTAPETGG